MKILSIDAWGNEDGGYDWNSWCTVGNIAKEEFEQAKTDKQYRLLFKRAGLIGSASARLSYIEDDQYNIVIHDRKTGAPVYAIEYGPEY
jgi:hypothetical protein